MVLNIYKFQKYNFVYCFPTLINNYLEIITCHVYKRFLISVSATDAFSFVDEMRQAAKHAENLNNFVYEPTSGLYYDHKTGYYYNAVNKL